MHTNKQKKKKPTLHVEMARKHRKKSKTKIIYSTFSTSFKTRVLHSLFTNIFTNQMKAANKLKFKCKSKSGHEG